MPKALAKPWGARDTLIEQCRCDRCSLPGLARGHATLRRHPPDERSPDQKETIPVGSAKQNASGGPFGGQRKLPDCRFAPRREKPKSRLRYLVSAGKRPMMKNMDQGARLAVEAGQGIDRARTTINRSTPGAAQLPFTLV